MILVTGGAGFIGSELVERLCQDEEVIVIDDLTSGKKKNLHKVRNKTVFYKMSVLDDIKNILRDVDVIFHLAAQIDIRRSLKDPIYDLNVNVAGTINLIENASNLERIIFASSGGAVYGEPCYLPVDEKHPLNPISPYGISKATAEKYIQFYTSSYGLKASNLRYGNVYGERQDPRGEAGVIKIFLERIKRGKQPIIFGDGEQIRDYVYVDDVVEATIYAMKKEGIYNVGSGIGTSLNSLLNIISTVTGRRIKPVYIEPRKGEVKRIYLDITKVQRELGWKPKMSLKQGVEKVWEQNTI